MALPNTSLLRKAFKIKERAALKYNYFKNMLSGSYTSATIPLARNNKPMRYELINAAIKQMGYRNYLEIGCFSDEVYSHIVCGEKVRIGFGTAGNIEMTSDDFFKQNNEKFDCIFIDGIHEYDQVMRDIRNSLTGLNDGGTIFIDDCLPLRYEQQTLPPSSVVSTGDAWKAVVALRNWDELDTVVTLLNNGMAVVKKRNNSNKLSINMHNFKALKFDDLVNNYMDWMNIVEFDKALEFVGN